VEELSEPKFDAATCYAGLEQQAKQYEERRRYAEATPVRDQMLLLFRKLYPNDLLGIALHTQWLGGLYEVQRLHAAAEALYCQGIEIQRRVLLENDEALLDSLNNLARLYRGERRYEEAETLYREVMETRRRQTPDNFAALAGSINEVGWMCEVQGRNPEAVTLFREALELRRQIVPQDATLIIRSLSHLAYHFAYYEGDYDATQHYEEVYQFAVQTLGEGDPETQLAKSNCQYYRNYLENGDDAEIDHPNDCGDA